MTADQRHRTCVRLTKCKTLKAVLQIQIQDLKIIYSFFYKSSLSSVFRIRDNLRRIRILGSVHIGLHIYIWIRILLFFVSGFQDVNKK
jgi:hypothetical protein